MVDFDKPRPSNGPVDSEKFEFLNPFDRCRFLLENGTLTEEDAIHQLRIARDQMHNPTLAYGITRVMTSKLAHEKLNMTKEQMEFWDQEEGFALSATTTTVPGRNGHH